MQREDRRAWIEIASVAVVSFVLYKLNIFYLFLVPVQMLSLRRGHRALAYGASLVIAAIAVTALAQLARLTDQSLRNLLLILEIAVPTCFLGGMVLTNIDWAVPGVAVRRRSAKLGVVTALVGALSIPLFILVSQNDGLRRFFYEQIEAIRTGFISMQEEDPSRLYAISQLLENPEWLADLAVEVLLRSFLFSYFLVVSIGVWMGDFAASKTVEGVSRSRLSDYRVNPRIVWLFAASWALVLADVFVGIGAIRYVAWNMAIILLFLYGMQGVGIIRHFLVSRGVSSWLRVALAVCLVLALAWPGVNIAILVLVPGIGISETWIRYRKSVKE